VFDTIAFIKSLGGIAVWAHPFLSVDEETAREFLPIAIGYGLDGMETQYTKYSEETTVMAKRVATEFGLLESGGSDFHGVAKPGVKMGCGKGNLKIPLSIWEKLKMKGAGTR
jgi:predicted metal-dependent phosphoesterase TrpH